MKRLLIYLSLLPVLAALSLLVALWQRGVAFPGTMPGTTSTSLGADNSPGWGSWFFGGLAGAALATPAICLLDLIRNRTRDLTLEVAGKNLMAQWVWFTLYAAILTAIHLAFVPVLQTIPLAPLQFLLNLQWELMSSNQNFPFVTQGLGLLWMIGRVTARKPAFSPRFLWRQWKRPKTNRLTLP